jgi:hypothetical protein
MLTFVKGANKKGNLFWYSRQSTSSPTYNLKAYNRNRKFYDIYEYPENNEWQKIVDELKNYHPTLDIKIITNKRWLTYKGARCFTLTSRIAIYPKDAGEEAYVSFLQSCGKLYPNNDED